MTEEPEETAGGVPEQPCACMRDPFAALPPEMVPRAAPKKEPLRHVTCPVCGQVYWTNRETDLCFDCEWKGVRLPVPQATPEE